MTNSVRTGGGTIATKSGSLATFSPATPLVLTIVGSLAFALSWPAFVAVVLIFPTGRAPHWAWLTVRLWLIPLLVYALPWPSTPRDAQRGCASRGPCRRSGPYEAAQCADR